MPLDRSPPGEWKAVSAVARSEFDALPAFAGASLEGAKCNAPLEAR